MKETRADELRRKAAIELEALGIIRGYILAQIASEKMPKGIGDALYRYETKLGDISYDLYNVTTKVDPK